MEKETKTKNTSQMPGQNKGMKKHADKAIRYELKIIKICIGIVLYIAY